MLCFRLQINRVLLSCVRHTVSCFAWCLQFQDVAATDWGTRGSTVGALGLP